MTRDEICGELEEVLSSRDLAQTVSHDAFDPFVTLMAGRSDDAPTVVCWFYFMKGWDSR